MRGMCDGQVARLRGLFEAQGFDLPTIEVFQSKRQNFRMRAEFRVWHQVSCCGVRGYSLHFSTVLTLKTYP